MIDFTITTRSPEEPFCGTIAQNTLWSNDKIYLIQCNVRIASGYTLTIQPGTVVKFMGNYNLNVGGTLVADGTPAEPVQFKGDTGIT